MLKLFTNKLLQLGGSYSIVFWFVSVFLITSSATRLILVYQNFAELGDSVYIIPISLIAGALFDLFISLWVTFPLVLALLIFPARWKTSAALRWLVSLAAFVFVFSSLYLVAAEIVFFDEFSSRFNYVAVDYLIYPHEVFINIWETYPILTILIVSGIISSLATWLAHKKLYRSILSYPGSLLTRFGIVILYSALIALPPLALGAKLPRVSHNRILNEITLNGVYTFFYAFLTNELDYNQYYMTMDSARALDRLKGMLKDTSAVFPANDSSHTISRFVTSDRELRRYNIVIVLEESLGSNYVGTFYPQGPALTPRLDSLIRKSMLFSNLYATGNRTVRGLEATLASFPPIPGRSIVKRPGSENVFTLPSILSGLDYRTVFLYGGLSYFDNFGHFASTNGFERVIDQTDIKDPVFTTIWGVSDEDLFTHALGVFDSLSEFAEPFFAAMITVSNHSPFTYPAGRIPFDPEDRRRENAVRYADYALGKFIADAKSHTFFDSTLFIFLADHGARVYGSEEIPLRSYEIPALFYCPQLIPEGEVIDVLCSQLDLAPTILDFLGIDYNSMFFGRSVLSTPEGEARAWMSHNRDVSLLKNDTLVVLGIQGGAELWERDKSGVFHPLAESVTSPLIEDAVAYYMTAYNMFKNRQLHPLDQVIIQ